MTAVILKMGDDRLRKRSDNIEDFGSQRLQGVIQTLHEAMQTHGGIGIAAPQIGIFERLTLIGGARSARYPHAPDIPFRVFLNIEWFEANSEKEDGWEGCLSVPGLRGLVPRYKNIRYRAFDISGKETSGQAEGFFARVIQHECDHLDGILYPDRIKDMRFFGFEDALGSRIYGVAHHT